MTPNEVAAKLQHFNDWRRGHHNEQPDPREIGEALDAAVEMIERLEAAEKAVAEAYQLGYETGQEEVEKERDALRAKIAEMEKQRPVAHVWRCDNGHIHGSCESELLMGQQLYALPGARPAPSVPDGWKLVPIVSTDEMDSAGSDRCYGFLSTAQAVWAAMLAAAPEAKP